MGREVFDKLGNRDEIARRKMRHRAVAHRLEASSGLDLDRQGGTRQMGQEYARAERQYFDIGSEFQRLLRRQFDRDIAEGEAGGAKVGRGKSGVLVRHGLAFVVLGLDGTPSGLTPAMHCQ
ncbi:hypothetical protein GCM10023067_50990 [Aminobacter aganoensis]